MFKIGDRVRRIDSPGSHRGLRLHIGNVYTVSAVQGDQLDVEEYQAPEKLVWHAMFFEKVTDEKTNLKGKKMFPKKGDKFVYTERNSVFEIHALPADPPNGTYTVYYPLTGNYRRYSLAHIRQNCTQFVKPPKKKAFVPDIIVEKALTGLPNDLILSPHSDTIKCGCHKGKVGSYSALVKALKGKLGKK